MNSRNMVISLIGRPNVGKSSLFNALMKQQFKTMTHDMPGVTRDRHYGIATFNDKDPTYPLDAILVDTGGFYPDGVKESEFTKKDNVNSFFNIMTEQAAIAIGESDLVLFVGDAREGMLPIDEKIIEVIRSKGKKFWVLANKVDSDSQVGLEADFYSLGIDAECVFPVSASHARGLFDLRERIHQELMDFEHKKQNEAPSLSRGVTPREEVVAKVALIGAPNAGKSTLLNSLTGSKRALVSEIAGTTVDPIEAYFDLFFGPDALKLEKSSVRPWDDGTLCRQYEEFRKNNQDFYQSMMESYVVENDGKDELDELFEDEDELNFEQSDSNIDLDQLDSQSDEYIESENMQFDDELSQEIYSNVFEETMEAVENKEEEEEESQQGSHWRSIHLVDTAGIRRRKSVTGFIEEQSVYRSLRCITESDIVIYMIDATKGIGHQDRRLIDIALEKGKSVIVALNKSDLIRKTVNDPKKRKEWIADLRRTIPWLEFCELIPISAQNGRGLGRLKASLRKTILVRKSTVPTGELNRSIFEMVERFPIVLKKSGGKRFKVKYASMVKSDPPTVLLFTNKSKGIPENYKKYLKNALRKDFGFENTPIHLVFRTGSDLAKRIQRIQFNQIEKQY
ncbi:MAG: hypothetical protein Fur0010_14760 [Bdellovibrio sp.]